MQAFQEDVVADGRLNVRQRMVSRAVEEGPYRLRSASDTVWGGNAAYGHRETFWQKVGRAVTAVLRMILPVLTLLACFAGLYLYRDTPVSLFLDGTSMPWLTVGHLLIPLGFFSVFLTNRRFGPAYAFAQVVVASALVVSFIVFATGLIATYVPQDTVPAMREAIGFGSAFFVASFVSIVVFDGARGAQWWTAPFFGFLSAAIFFALVFFPVAYAGTNGPWVDHGLTFMGVLAGEGILLLIPYWMLRRMVPPLSGFGGY